MHKKKVIEVAQLLSIQKEFVKERDWEQFHTPKNIALALGIEASELTEIFLWLKDAESKSIMKDSLRAQKVREELADIFYWVLRLSDVLDIDLEDAFLEKMKQNRRKYPVRLSKGKMTKYTELKRKA